MRVLEAGRARPAPLTAFDAFVQLGPIVEMRGSDEAVRHYAGLLSEVEDRAARGVGAVRDERIRLLWDNLPVWPRMRWLSDLLAGEGAALVGSTYARAWGELASMIDPADPIGSGARVYLHPILNRGTGHKLRLLREMASDFGTAGVILHSNRSCRPYTIGQVDQREALEEAGVPALLLEADHADPRSFSEAQVRTRILAFLERLA
jgi:benzoyl-CoA reductase/2-hydroxyglutaryl-CoA dehydratase subunit BcrC/BadD/HgdB